MSTDWLCHRCLLDEERVEAVTLSRGTALCEACAKELADPSVRELSLVMVDSETGQVVHAPVPATWPRLFSS